MVPKVYIVPGMMEPKVEMAPKVMIVPAVSVPKVQR